MKNATAQKEAFSQLYYNSASTDFETYFGLEIFEARSTFCWGHQTIKDGGVYPREYYESLYSGIPYSLPASYVKAQRIRSTLRNCMAESLRDPNPIQPPTIPGKKCRFESAEGEMNTLVVEKVNQWVEEGHTVYYEGFKQCGIMDRVEQYLDRIGPIKIAIKTCQE
jgi:hypothetical protein